MRRMKQPLRLLLLTLLLCATKDYCKYNKRLNYNHQLIWQIEDYDVTIGVRPCTLNVQQPFSQWDVSRKRYSSVFTQSVITKMDLYLLKNVLYHLSDREWGIWKKKPDEKIHTSIPHVIWVLFLFSSSLNNHPIISLSIFCIK